LGRHHRQTLLFHVSTIVLNVPDGENRPCLRHEMLAVIRFGSKAKVAALRRDVCFAGGIADMAGLAAVSTRSR